MTQSLGAIVFLAFAAACGPDEPKVLGQTEASCDPSSSDSQQPSTTTARTGTSRPTTQQPTSTRNGATPTDTSSGTSSDTGAAGVGDTTPPAIPNGVDCSGAPTLTPTMTVGGNIRNPGAVWKGVVHVTGDVDAYDCTVTIEPGTVIVVDKGRSILMGDLGEVTLTAAGTASRPILFCGSAPGQGHWAGLVLKNMGPASELSNVLIDGSGGKDGALSIGGPVLLQSVRITNSGSDGLHADSLAEGSYDLSIENSAGYPVAFYGPNAVTRFPKQAVFMDNMLDLAPVRFPNGRGVNLTFHDIGIPYLQEGDFEGGGGGAMAQMAFEAGVEYQIAKGRGINVSGNVQIMGTAKAPVLIHGAQVSKGFWKGLTVSTSAAPGSIISNLIVADAGSNDAFAFHLRAAIELHGVTVKDSASGAYFEYVPADGSDNFSSLGNDGSPLTVEVAALTKIPEGGMIQGAAGSMIKVNRTDVPAGTIPAFGLPYAVDGLGFGQKTDIAPGAEFVVAAGKNVITTGSGTITAKGSAAKPIVFRGEKDASGSWGGIVVQNAGNTFSHVNVFNAGLNLRKPADVTYCRFSGSPTYGITKDPSDMTDYEETNTFSNNAMGNVSK